MKRRKRNIWILMIAAIVIVFFAVLGRNKIEKMQSFVSNNNNNQITAEDESYIYMSDIHIMRKISKEDGSVSKLYVVNNPINMIHAFEYFEGGLYIVTVDGDLISMDTDGNVMEEMRGAFESVNHIKSYCDGQNLFFYRGDFLATEMGEVYRVNPETFGFEDVSSRELKYQFVAADGTVFEKDMLTNTVYATYKGEKVLFSEENESVILNRMNFTDKYVFYMAYLLNESTEIEAFHLYRVDLDGKHKKLIKELDLGTSTRDVQYDNQYIYLQTSDTEYLRIDKKTLREKNIMSEIENAPDNFEISNGKIFAQGCGYYMDCKTGEKEIFYDVN